MDTDKCSPVDRLAPPQPKAGSEKNRRTRIDRELPADLKEWLVRTTRVHAHLCMIVRLYGNPSKAGGQSNEGEAYAARAARGDRTLLYDCLGVARDEIDAVREEIQKQMDSATPTAFLPGSPEKVEEMAARMARGESLFIDADAQVKA